MPAAFPRPANVTAQPLPIDPFSEAELLEFRLCESVLESSLPSCRQALLIIKDRRLFREYHSLRKYAKERFQVSEEQLNVLLTLPTPHV